MYPQIINFFLLSIGGNKIVRMFQIITIQFIKFILTLYSSDRGRAGDEKVRGRLRPALSTWLDP